MKRLRLGLAALLGQTLSVCLTAGHAQGANPANFAVTVSMIQPPALTATKYQSPAAPGIGSPVTYAIVVRNSGTATVTGLTVVDTVSPVIVPPYVTDQPAGMTLVGGPLSVAGGTRFEWSGGSLAFGPGQTFTFTITGAVGLVCVPTAISNTAWIKSISAGGTAYLTTSVGSVVAPASENVNVFNVVTGGGVPGSPVNYAITISNNGTATVTGLLVVDTLPLEIVNVFQTAANALPVGATTSGSVFSWFVPNINPGTAFTLTLSGVVGAVCNTTTIGNTAYWEASWPCVAGGLSSAKADTFVVPAASTAISVVHAITGGAGAGAPVTFRIDVTNMGTATVTGLTLADTLSPLLVNVLSSQPGAFGPPSVAASGTATVYGWTATGLTFGPGQTFTFTLSGNVGVPCASSVLSATGMATVLTACDPVTGASFIGVPAGVPVAPHVETLLIGNVLGGGGPAGSPVSYTITVQNTGTATLTGIVVTSTLPPTVTGVVQGGPFAVQPVVSTASGTLYSWISPTLAPGGAAAVLTLSGVVGEVCTSVTVGNTAYIAAVGACAGPLQSSAASAVYAVPAPTVSLMAGIGQGGPALVGAASGYTFTVQNNGSATITSLTVTDTVPSELLVTGTTEPGGWAAPVMTSVASGTRYVWSNASIVLGPGQMLSFGVNGRFGAVCAASPLAVQAYADGGNACATASSLSPVASDTLLPHSTLVSVTTWMTPAAPVATGPVMYTIVAVNTGTATITSLTVTDSVSNLVTAGTPLPGPAGFGAPAVANIAGGGTRYEWSGTGLSFLPGQVFTFTITGTVGVTAVSVTAGTTAMVTADASCGVVSDLQPGEAFTIAPTVVLSATLSAQPLVVSTGQSFLATFDVGNIGAGTGNNGSATIWRDPSSTGGVSFSGISAPATASIPSGGRVVYTWTVTALSAGTVVFTGTTYTDEDAFGPVSSAAVTIQNAMNLATGSGGSVLSAVCPTGSFVMTQRFYNQGTAAANSVTATVWQSSGAGEVSWSPPEPAGPVTIPGGAVQVFSWTVSGRVSGLVGLTVTITGFDANSGAIGFATSVTGTTSVAVPAILGIALSGPAAVNVGSAVTLTFTVTNSGEVMSVSSVVSATTTAGTGVFGAVAPASAAIASFGGVQSYTVSYTPQTAGVHAFSVTVSGQSCTTITVTATATGSLTASAAAALSGTLIVTTPASGFANVGGIVVVTLTVTNTGGTTANAVNPSVTPTGAAVSGPAIAVLAGGGNIAGGGMSAWSFTYTTTGAGTLNFAGGANGTDAISAAVVAVTGLPAGPVTVQTPAVLTITSFTANTSATCLGEAYAVYVQVNNTGGAGASVVSPTLWVSSGPAAGLPGPTPGVAVIPGGQNVVFTWTITALAGGSVTYTATVSGLDSNTLAFVSAGPQVGPSVGVSAPAVLAAAVASPVSANVGSPVTVYFTATNTGGSAATGVTFSLTTTAGTGLFGAIAPAPATLAGGGGAQVFSAAYTPLTSGAHDFSVTASGGTCATTVFAPATGSLTATAPAALSGTLIVTMPAAGITSTGGLVVVTLTVTNSGGTAANAVNPSLTPTGVAGVVFGPTQVLGGPNIAGGAASAWVWSYTVTGSGSLTFSGGANGTDAVSSAVVAVTGLPAGPVTIQTPAALSIASFNANATSTCLGESYAVYLRVNNTGQAAATAVSPTLWTASGPGLPGPAPASAAIAGGGNVVFTWTITSLAPGAVAYTATVAGLEANLGTPVVIGPTAGPGVTVVSPAVLAAAVAAPPTANTGLGVTVTFTVTNTGGGSATGVTVSATSLTGTLSAFAPSGVTIAGGFAQTFSATYTPAVAGANWFSVTATGLGCAGPIAAGVTGGLTGTSPAALSGTLIVTAPASGTEVVGGTIVVRLDVTNTGGAAASGVTPGAMTVFGGVGGALAGPLGSNTAYLNSGATATFIWNLSPAAAGTASFQVAANGTDVNSAAGVGTGNQLTPGVLVVNPAALTSLVSTSGGGCAGQPVTVNVQVSNAAGAAVANVGQISLWNSAASPATAGVTGPVPALPFDLGPGQSQVFVYTATPSTSGNLTFTASASGADTVTAATTTSAPATATNVAVSSTALVGAMLSFVPATASNNQTVQVRLLMQNGGGSAATIDPVALPQVNAGSGSRTLTSAASTTLQPAGASGSEFTFTWNYVPSVVGTHELTATGTGTTCGALPVIAPSTGSLVVVAPAQISSTLVITMPSGTVLVQGDLVVVELTIDNNGTATARMAAPGPLTPSLAGTLSAPMLLTATNFIAGGGSATWAWSFTVAGAGTLTFNAPSSTATDVNSGSVVTTAVSTAGAWPLQSLVPAGMVVSMAAPGSVIQGTAATVTIYVTNTGGTDLRVDSIGVGEVDPGNLAGPATPDPNPAPTGLLLAAGATQAFQWDYNTVIGCGIFWTTAFVDASEEIGGVPTGRTFGPAYLTRMIGVTATSYSAIVGVASPASAEVATDTLLTFTVFDTCLPPVPVSSVPVTLTIIGGNGFLGAGNVTTGGTGSASVTLRLGTAAGPNVVRADAVGGGSPSTAVSVEGTTRAGTQDFLSQNLFDPKRGQAMKIRVFLPAAARVSARIFNLAGELVRTVRDDQMPAGVVVYDWDGRTDGGEYVANGVYFIQIVAGKDVQLKRVIVLKY